MISFFAGLLCGITGLFCSANLAAQPVLNTSQGGTGTTSPSGILVGDSSIRLKTLSIGSNLSFDGTTLSSTASGGSGTVSTSTNETIGLLPYWTTTSGTPAKLGAVATTTLTASSPLSFSNPVAKVGGSNSVLSLDTSGTWTGNAGTASALAADPSDCSAGSFTLGINAAGTAQGCTDAWTEAENTAAGYINWGWLFPSNATSTALSFTGGITALGWDVGTTTAVVCKDTRGCNYTTIQGAIDDGWTDILVKNGTYAEQITFIKAKTKLRAESLNTIIQCNGATQSPCVSSAGFDEATIQGFTINEANASLNGVAIDFSNSAIFRILDNRVNNFATSTQFIDTASETFYGSIERNTFFSPRTCIEFGGTQPNANGSSNNRCRTMQSPLAGFGIYLVDTRGFTSISDDFEGTTTSNGVTGIYVSTTSREISFTNPWVEANAVGVLVDTGANRVTFTGGSITSNGTDITDNGTQTVFLNTSDTGVLVNSFGSATSSNFHVSNLFGFAGLWGNSWDDFCTAITGGSGLCDGSDADTTYTAGDHITLTGNDFDVDDDFLLNTGDTGTGNYTLQFASTTAFSTDYASSTAWWGGGLLSTCAAGNFLTWTAGVFGCSADQVGAAGTIIVSTSTSETAGHVPYWTTTAGTPAKLGSIATSTPTIGTGLSYSGTAGNFVGGTSGTLTATLGTTIAPNELVGQSGFTTNELLYVNTGSGTFASAPTTSLAVDSSISSSASLGAQVGGSATTLSLNMANANTWTALQTFANASSTLFSSSYASTTDLIAGHTFTFGGVTGTAWSDFCTAITGSSGLCDGTDDTGAGGGAWPFTPATNFATSTQSTTTPAWYTLGIYASSTSQFDYASTSALSVSGLTASRAVFTDSNKGLTSSGTVGAIEAAVGSQNILLETEIDGCSELAALLDDETGGCGTNGVVFQNAPTLTGLTTLANATSTLFTATTGWLTNLFIGADTIAEYIADTVGAMWSGNTETGGAITYDDSDNTLDFVCNTASGSIFGCLSSSDWTTFNNKESALTFNWPLSRSTNTISFNGLATTTPWTTSGVAYRASDNSITTVATGTVSAGTGISISATIYALLNAASIAIDQAANLTWTGAHDFGDATSLEIPNGTAPTVDAAGEIALDTTDMQILVSTTSAANPRVLPTIQRLWGATIASTSPDLISGGRIWLPPQRDGFTVKELHCAVDGGTSVVVNVSNSSGTTDSETVTCDADGAQDTDITTNPNYAAGSLNSLEIGTVTGAIDYLTIAIYGVYTRE